MRILLAWELGGNYGHLAKLLGLALALRQKGHDVLFAVRDIDVAGRLLAENKLSYVQAPRPAVCTKRLFPPVSFADILAGAGFGSCQVLEPMVGSWRDIFISELVDVLVAQYAPVARFAARLFDVPCLSLHTGFESPPAVAPFPCFRPGQSVSREQLIAREAKIVQQINRISFIQSQSISPYRSLPEIITSDMSLLVTLPELDHYPNRRNGCYIGPLAMLDHGVSLSWKKKSTLRIFLYLRPFPGIESILNVLRASGADVIACIPDVAPETIALYRNSTVRITPELVRLSDLLPDMTAAITHAGHGTTSAAMLAGVPMLLLPTTIEQWLMSRSIEQLGAGIAMRRKMIEKFPAALATLLSDPSYRVAAKKIAAKYAGYDQEQTITRLAKTIEKIENPVWPERQSNRQQNIVSWIDPKTSTVIPFTSH